MNEYVAYFDGEWMPWNQVRVHPSDRGFRLGDAVFDVTRTFNGRAYDMEGHVKRLYQSLKHVRIDPGLDPAEITELTEEVITRNEQFRESIGDYQVWQFVTRGPGRWAHTAGPPTVCIKVEPVDFTKWASLYATGAHAVVTKTQNHPVTSLDPRVKHYSRLHFSLAELEAADVDPEAWPILMDAEGNVTESSGVNLFTVVDDTIRTPGRNILEGRARAATIELARALDIEVAEMDLQPYDLHAADEVFFTGSSPCVIPVTTCDGRPVGEGKPGPMAQRLLDAWSEEVGLDVVDQAVRFAQRRAA